MSSGSESSHAQHRRYSPSLTIFQTNQEIQSALQTPALPPTHHPPPKILYYKIVVMPSYKCPSCPKHFTPANPPHRLVNCHHLLCKRCLISREDCLSCGSPVGLDEHQLADYVVTDIPDPRPSREQLLGDEVEEHAVQQCLLHAKPADLICVEDHAIICCNCALFGQHKGHDVINCDGILNKMTNYVEECLCVYEVLKSLQKEFNLTNHTENFMHILIEERAKHKKAIDDKFSKLYSSVEVAHRKAIMRLDGIYKQKQESFTENAGLKELETHTLTWYEEIERLGGFMDSTTNLEKLVRCLPYIDKSGKGDQILNHGQKLIEQLTQLKEEAETLYKAEQNLNIFCFDEDIGKSIQKFCKFPSKESRIKPGLQRKTTLTAVQAPNQPPAQTQPEPQEAPLISIHYEAVCLQPKKPTISIVEPRFIEDNLLQSVEPYSPYMSNYNGINGDEGMVERIATQVYMDNIPMLSISDIKPVTNVYSYPSSDQSRFLSRDKELQEMININTCSSLQVGLDNQKKKKLGKLELLPEKFKGIIDDLKNDRAETIDLTAADCGDSNIFTICPFIRKSKKLKVLKLIKNKLTDECLPELLLALSESNVTSLNLSQNLITDKICDYLQDYNNAKMKTLTLTLNKINRRQSKPKVDSLSKRGLNVVL